MKQSTSFLKRCLALALALVLIASNAGLGVAQKVVATESDKLTVTEGAIVANHYDLTDAEKALIKSGLLVGESQEFSKPTDADNLISVDTDKMTVTVKNYEDAVSNKTWMPASVKIVADGETKETLTLKDGVYPYTYDGAAFSVEVEYAVSTTVDADVQADMLRAASFLKTGKSELDAIYKNRGSLTAYHTADEYLIQLAEGIEIPYVGTLQFQSQEAIDSAKELHEQYATNGKLDMYAMASSYKAPYTQYLVENGAALKAEAVETYEHINNIMSDKVFELLKDENSTLTIGLKGYNESLYTAVMELFVPSMETWLSNMLSVIGSTWPNNETAPVKASMTAAEYETLDSLVGALGTPATGLTVSETLVAATASVKLNMSMYNVNVKVELMVVEDAADSDTLVSGGETKTATVTLAQGATAEEILTAVKNTGVEAAALSAWSAYDEAHYEATNNGLPSELTQDYDYVITYAPKSYKVTGYTEAEYPYGYQLTLPLHDYTPDTVYDYTVDGKYYAEGKVVEILGDTVIARAEGAARQEVILKDYVVETDEDLTTDEKAILTHPAVSVGTSVISIRFPSDSLVTLDEANDVVTAQKVLSDYPSAELYWVPTTAEVTVGNTVTPHEMTEGANGYTAEITEKSYDLVTVVYVLNLADQNAGNVKNMPYVLKTEAASQLNRMGMLLTKKNSLYQVAPGILEMLKGYATGETLDALNDVLNNCFADDGYLKLYHSLVEYEAKEDGAQKLAYYYKNYDAISGQLNILVKDLKVIAADDAFLDTCKTKLPQYVDDINQITEIGDELDNIALPTPNAAIDVNSTSLNALTELLTGEGKVNSYASAALKMHYKVSKTPSGKVTITVKLVQGANNAEVKQTVNIGNSLDADAFMVDYNAALVKLGITAENAKYYTDNSAKVAEILKASYDATYETTLTWTANEYKVESNGVDYGTVSINDTYITLPVHTEEGMEYIYYVNGVKTNQGESVKVDIDNLASLNITREEVNAAENVAKDRFEQFMSELNAKDDAIYFNLSDDETTITMEVAAAATQAELMESVTNFVVALVRDVYKNVSLDNETLYEGAKVSIQTLVDAILNDGGFNNAGVAKALSEDTPLLTTTMQLGTSEKTEKELVFEVKLVGTTEQLTSAANALNAITPYVAFQSNNGKLDVNVNLPEKVYEVYLTALLAAGEVDITDMNAVNTAIATMFVYDYMMGIIGDDSITTTTFQNTLAILDETAADKLPDYNLTQYENRYQQLRTVLNQWATVSEIKGENAYPQINIKVPAKTAINAVLSDEQLTNMGAMLDQIKEYGENGNITAEINVTLVNTNKDFQAVVIDAAALKDGASDLKAGVTKDKLVALVKGQGMANGIDYTSNLATRMSAVEGAAIVVLLDNVDADLTFNGATIMDLNGKTITGDITANGHLYIFDSSLSTTNCGGVDGDIKGNVTIVAGNYTDTVTDFLADGYVQNGKAVQNTLYTIETDGGNITFVVNTDVIDEEIDSYVTYAKALAAEATLDLVRNYYISALLSADGNKIYDVNFDDLIGLLASDSTAADLVDTTLACISLPGTAEFINVIVEDLLAFGDIEDALNGDGVVASYALTAAPWAVTVEHITDGDYITAGFGSDDENVENYTVTLKMVGDNNATLANFFGLLDDIVEDDTYVKLVDVEDLTFSNKHFNLTGGIEANLHADLSDYTTYMAIVLANSAEGDAKQAIVDAVNKGDKAALKDAFDAITVKDVFTALKVLERGDDFATMAKDAGITVKIDLTAKQEILEKLLVVTLSAAGRALEELDVTGNGAMLGNLDKDDDGVYDLAKAISRSGDVTKRGYGVNYNLTTADATVKVKLFDVVDCLWGDANHDGKVDGKDITMYRWQAMKNTYPEIDPPIDLDDFCQVRTDFNADGIIDGKDITYVRWLAMKYTYPEIEAPINLDEFYVEQ